MDPSKDFSDTPTLADPELEAKARALTAYWRRVEFHIACWEADELTAGWNAIASNYSDDFQSDIKTVEVKRP